jgi:hypothetical protein
MNEIVLRHKKYVNLSIGQSVGRIISTINIIKIWIYFISLREKSSRLLEKNTRAGARGGACPWGFSTHALPLLWPLPFSELSDNSHNSEFFDNSHTRLWIFWIFPHLYLCTVKFFQSQIVRKFKRFCN